MSAPATAAAQAKSDAEDRLVSADELLRGLQERCGGVFPGTIAIPALLEAVRKSRQLGMKLARPITTRDGAEAITAWIEIEPDTDGGCLISVRHWQVRPLPAEVPGAASRQAEIDRNLAEFHARLNGDQGTLTAETEADELKALANAMLAARGNPWTDFVAIAGADAGKALHWRLIDGAEIQVAGSERLWRASLTPIGLADGEPEGFDLTLVSDTLPPPLSGPPVPAMTNGTRLIGRDVAPVLRQPIARIIANAETIRTRLAGPIAEEYSNYAADIAAAGQHLLALIDDLTDLEVVESEDFITAPDRIDLADVARRAAGILGVRARELGIVVDAPRAGETLSAVAEFRRVLQVLLNLVGNAIRYSPANSQVWIRLAQEGSMAQVIVADQGPGLAEDQQSRVFEKFERLGRSGDGGSGLGLYISRRLARAMGGDLTVESAPGHGARFILSVPCGAEKQSGS